MRIAITGGTGTLGRSLISRCLTRGAERVVSLSRDEVKAGELVRDFGDPPALRVFLGDVRDRDRLTDAFRGCDTVVHAAALKRITESVYSPGELIQTNILGTMNVIRAAAEAGVARVLVISSDKAVHAANLYGATKFAAECYAVQANSVTFPRGTLVSCTRYGNVLDSRGGVLEVWRRALRYGKPLPLTHPDMTRFVLSSTEAARFVTACLERMRGGEVFVPDLPAMRLVDLAEALAPGHPTETVGLRPGGEKIHEVLLSDEEMTRLRRSERGGPLFVTPSHRSWSAIPYDGVEATVAEYRSDRVTRLSVKELRDRCTAGLFTALRRWCGSDELREGSS